MSSALVKSLPFARIPLVRYSVSAKRRNMAEVQLLKDFPSIGKKGQILKVSHSLMRNKLHPKNGAAYILPDQGPRIPVYKEPIKKVEVKEKKVVSKNIFEPAKPKKPSIDIEGLLLPTGNLFNSAEQATGYSLFSLSVNLGDLMFKVPAANNILKKPITKEDIQTQIRRLADIEVPLSDLTLLGNNRPQEVIKNEGIYEVQIGTGKETISKNVLVRGTN